MSEQHSEPTPIRSVPPVPPVPDFEGKAVAGTRLKLTSASNLECDDAVLHHDDIVRVVVDARVTNISHPVNERTGEMERVQTLKALDVQIVPWNPNDPTDTGVFRQ